MNEYLEKNPFQKMSAVVYGILENDILTYRISPGTKLNCSQIANDLNISRTPVSEAIDLLVEKGLVKEFDNRSGYYVFEMSRSTLEDLFFARKLIEGNAAYLCTVEKNRVDKKTLKELAISFRNVFYERNFEKLNDLDIKFHRMIVEASNNEFLIDMYEHLQKMIIYHSHRTTYFLTEFPINREAISLADQHISIYKAIDMGVPEMALNSMNAHLDCCINYARRCELY